MTHIKTKTRPENPDAVEMVCHKKAPYTEALWSYEFKITTDCNYNLGCNMRLFVNLKANKGTELREFLVGVFIQNIHIPTTILAVEII